MPIAEYEAEFQWLYNRAKSYVMVLSYSTWAHMFLNSGSISVSNERLMLATFTNLSYETMKTQLKKIFQNSGLFVASNKAKNTCIRLERAGAIVYWAIRDSVDEQVHYGRYKNTSTGC